MKTQTETTYHDQTLEMLHELSFPLHRLGYHYLCIAIPYFARNGTQSLSKGVYPYLETYFRHSDRQAIESSIRDVISDAWELRDPQVWEKYFSHFHKAPTNKQFIAALAERLR